MLDQTIKDSLIKPKDLAALSKSRQRLIERIFKVLDKQGFPPHCHADNCQISIKHIGDNELIPVFLYNVEHDIHFALSPTNKSQLEPLNISYYFEAFLQRTFPHTFRFKMALDNLYPSRLILNGVKPDVDLIKYYYPQMQETLKQALAQIELDEILGVE